MRGDAKPLVKMLQGADTRFVIPVYQRNYDWRQRHASASSTTSRESPGRGALSTSSEA